MYPGGLGVCPNVVFYMPWKAIIWTKGVNIGLRTERTALDAGRDHRGLADMDRRGPTRFHRIGDFTIRCPWPRAWEPLEVTLPCNSMIITRFQRVWEPSRMVVLRGKDWTKCSHSVSEPEGQSSDSYTFLCIFKFLHWTWVINDKYSYLFLWILHTWCIT